MVNHIEEARRVIAAGEESIAKLRSAHDLGDINEADDYGKKASGCWAQAQAHATLALVEQQRIANLLTFHALATTQAQHVLSPADHERIDHVAVLIRDGLGI